MANQDHQPNHLVDGLNIPDWGRMAILAFTSLLVVCLAAIFLFVTGSMLLGEEMTAYEMFIASTMGGMPASLSYHALRKKARFDVFSAIMTSFVVFICMAGPWLAFFVVNIG